MRTNFDAVKQGIGNMTSFQDATLGVWYDEAFQFALEAGVSEEYLKSEAAVGLLARGVLDLWDYGSGTGDFSKHFRMRVAQARLNKGDENGETEV